MHVRVPQGLSPLSGIVKDCCCDYETVDRLNEARPRARARAGSCGRLRCAHCADEKETLAPRARPPPQEVLYPLLSRLTQQPFFRYFKVNLYCDCPFWCGRLPVQRRARLLGSFASASPSRSRCALAARPDDGMCALPDCSVCECPADEVPLPWRTPADAPTPDADAPTPPAGDAAAADCASDASGTSAEALLNAREGAVNRTLDVGPGFRAWRELDNPWTADDEAEAGADMTYVNLVLNPERYTGYAGEHARRVWDAIYAQPCFDGVAPRQCAAGDLAAAAAAGDGAAGARHDVRLFYRLISGLHTSISTHIAAEYLVDRQRGVWGPNLGLWHTRVGAHTERQENLYLTTLFVLRAVLKAGDFLMAADYRTGAPRCATGVRARRVACRPCMPRRV
jgi:ERO1-like protein alpha